jgi:hypothetical protein
MLSCDSSVTFPSIGSEEAKPGRVMETDQERSSKLEPGFLSLEGRAQNSKYVIALFNGTDSSAKV